MVDPKLMAVILDGLKDPLVFVDTDHIIRYMNRVAINHYEEGPDLIGRSVFECHTAQSQQKIKEIFAAFQAGGEEERLITDDEKHRIYMRVVRDAYGQLIGYYERYEPPVPKTSLE